MDGETRESHRMVDDKIWVRMKSSEMALSVPLILPFCFRGCKLPGSRNNAWRLYTFSGHISLHIWSITLYICVISQIYLDIMTLLCIIILNTASHRAAAGGKGPDKHRDSVRQSGSRHRHQRRENADADAPAAAQIRLQSGTRISLENTCCKAHKVIQAVFL